LHTHLLAVDVNPYSPQTRTFLRSVESAMIVHGSTTHTAVSQSYGAIWGMVERQASMLAFVDTFLAMAVVFSIDAAASVHHEEAEHPRAGAAIH